MSTAPPPSLLARIARGLIVVSLLAVCSAAGLLYLQFASTDDRVREHTLQGESRLLQRFLEGPDAHLDLPLPPELTESLRDSAARFAVIDAAGHLLAASEQVTAALEKVDEKHPREYFTVPPTASSGRLYGISRRVEIGGRRLWIQVASTDRELQSDSLLEEFIGHLAWLWVPFVVVLLVVNLMIIRRALLPLRQVSATAAGIGPENVAARLPEVDLPREVLPLVQAVNSALTRLENGYRVQRQFIADVAHDLRTPLAVLKAHLDLLGDAATVRALAEDVAGMERLVNQLLDASRLEVLQLHADDRCDLAGLAVAVATQLAPLAIDSGRSLEVLGAEAPVVVNGVHDYLFRALRNVVENALAHTPRGTTVSIRVGTSPAPSVEVRDRGPGVPPEQRELIFRRFWQGGRRRDRAGGSGAGLGMAIVERTLAMHHGHVSVDDAAGGGALFTLHFPPCAEAGGESSPVRVE
ncbi:sensor histidine kinase [Plasticicumulans acidivorans]|uniref:histidine kinase n=1 Tax=Plasticicumulans acidivorans TaxID=886464 RepID=A0A317N0B9_9GAMM|nr:ATP-binding protein [Plasticicumulans acidivorans]PWV65703.1 signal transduction histidine kinase [Plasticicumulans acidivorans]